MSNVSDGLNILSISFSSEEWQKSDFRSYLNF